MAFDAKRPKTCDMAATWEYNNAMHHTAPPRWIQYDGAATADLEALFATGGGALALPDGRGGSKYTVDIERMVQRNSVTGYLRDVRRIDFVTGQTRGGLGGVAAVLKGKSMSASSRTVYSAPPPPFSARANVADVVPSSVTHAFTAVSSQPDWATVTSWKRLYPPEYDPAEEDLMGDSLGDGVAIPVVELSCSTKQLPCVFRQNFITRALQTKPVCCKCGFQFNVPGPQPSGTMQVSRIKSACQGYSTVGSIQIEYTFPNGIQTEQMPNPGVHYSGTARTAFLPDDTDGRNALRLLELAFQHGKLFTVGHSITTGRDNVVIWGGVHQKTSQDGGVAKHGWPDSTYFNRLKSTVLAVTMTTETIEPIKIFRLGMLEIPKCYGCTYR